MSFIGLVTRKEKDTGVTLLAKIVTPSKKKSAKKAFKVKVKANALDDYSCCVIDHATVKTRIENSQELGAMIEDIVLSYNGVNGTAIRYELNDKPNSYPKLTDFIGEDGKLLGRPKYSPSGGGNAEGTLTIIVTKGEAEVRSNLQIAVKAITADEVFAKDIFTKQRIWEVIRGNNEIQYSDATHDGGNHKIDKPLSLVSEIRCDDVSTVPVKVSYTIQDDLAQYLPQDGNCLNVGETGAFLNEDGELVKCRINSTTGEVTRFSFASSAYLCNTLHLEGSQITNDVMVSNRRVRLSGLTITVSLSLDESTSPRLVILDAAVLSKYLTNEEVWKNLLDKNFKYFSNDVQQEFGDNINTISKIGANDTFVLKFPSEDYCTTLESQDLGIKAGEIRNGIQFNYSLRSNSGTEYDVIDRNTAFKNKGELVVDATGYFKELTVDLTGMATLATDKRNFSVSCDVIIGGFSPNGINPIGATYNINRIAKFQVNVVSSAS